MVSCFMTFFFQQARTVREAPTQGQGCLLGLLERTSVFGIILTISSCPVLNVLTSMSYFNSYEAKGKQTGPLWLPPALTGSLTEWVAGASPSGCWGMLVWLKEYRSHGNWLLSSKCSGAQLSGPGLGFFLDPRSRYFEVSGG